MRFLNSLRRMDISAGIVPAVSSLTGRMDPVMNTNIKTEYMRSKYISISIKNI